MKTFLLLFFLFISLFNYSQDKETSKQLSDEENKDIKSKVLDDITPEKLLSEISNSAKGF